MAKHPLSVREEQRDLSRRALIKWSVAAGAALGVSRSKIFDILEKTGGRGLAFAAAESTTTRSVHIVAGNGGLAWFTQLFPYPGIAGSGNTNFAYVGMGGATQMQGTFKPYFVNPNLTPFDKLAAARQMTCFVCGNNETHTNTPNSAITLNGNNIIAIASALQTSQPSVVPIITIGDTDAGTAPGSQRPAQVGNADGIVGLFNSAASRSLLMVQKNADLYKTQYDAFTQLNRASNRSTQKSSYVTASNAAAFLGKNLSAQLAIQPADLTRYGINGGVPNNVEQIARALIVAIKAFKMGLTNAVVIPAMRDDPHGAFADGSINQRPQQLKKVLDAFMADADATSDDPTGQKIGDNLTMTITGDTPKDARNPGGWPDGTPNNSNVMYVYSSGHLRSGWFGDINAQGVAQGFTEQGVNAAYNGANTAKLAGASVAFAIAKRDDRAISAFANGIKIAGVFGNEKAV